MNEPVTTARFSALYGLWHPHVRDEAAFWLPFSTRWTRCASPCARSARSCNGRARLIQTEDIGRSHATASLAYQARFDNDRRWMSMDLLRGEVGPNHRLWERLTAFGLGERLRPLLDDPAPPDVIGVNHYLTSDRFLDHRPELYPSSRRGGNGRAIYADVEAIRVADARAWPDRRGACGKPGTAIARRWRSPRCTTDARAKSSCAGSPRPGGGGRTAWPTASPSKRSPPGRCSARTTGAACCAPTRGTMSPGAYDIRSPDTALDGAGQPVAPSGRYRPGRRDPGAAGWLVAA